MPRFKRFIISCLLGWYIPNTYACTCPTPRGENWSSQRVQEEIGRSSHVFIGDVFSASRDTYQVRVLDAFKGSGAGDTLTGLNEHMTSCGLTVTPGLWVFYANLNAEGRIEPLGLCDFSGSLTEPALAFIPPLPNTAMDAASQATYVEAQRKQELTIYFNNWLNEYALLNAYRHRHQIPAQAPQANNYLVYLALGISLSALALTVHRNRRRP